MYTIWLRGIALVFLLVSCQGQDATYGMCSNSVVLLTKEELKNEIRAEMAEVIAKNSKQWKSNCTCNCNNNPLQDYNHTELLNMVEDKLKTLLLPIISYNPVQDYNFTELSSVVEDKLETLLLPIMNKLMSLHQPGMTASHPATSCSEIFNFNPRTSSGYYWLEASNGSAIRLYCSMTLSCKGVGGGWMQVAKLDMTNSSHQCPPGTNEIQVTYNQCNPPL